MAYVALPMRVRLLWVDDDSTESTSIIHIPAATDFDSALSFLTSWRQLAIAISSATCYGADLIVRYSENESPAPGADSDVLRSGVLLFGIDPLARTVVRVPSIDTSVAESSGPYAGIAIDQSNTAIVALVTALDSGIAGTEPCDPFGDDIGVLSTALIEQA